jgi:hypothetical protein
MIQNSKGSKGLWEAFCSKDCHEELLRFLEVLQSLHRSDWEKVVYLLSKAEFLSF